MSNPITDSNLITEKIKIYFINITKKSVGSFESLYATRNPIGDGNDRVEIVFQKPKASSKDKIEYYFNEEEWIEDIKKL